MKKTAKWYSAPLMKQTRRANRMLAVVILVLMCLISTVINYATSVMGTDTAEVLDETTQEDFFSYMFLLSSYNEAFGSELSPGDFLETDDKSDYEKAFGLYHAKNPDEEERSVSQFEAVLGNIEDSDIGLDTCVRQFEYTLAIAGRQGVFTGDELNMENLMETMLASAGITQESLDKMETLDFNVYFNKIYSRVIGLMPMLVWVIIIANGLIAAQVDKGSMAYILSTPTKRSAVTITQAIYMIFLPLLIMVFTCIARLISNRMIFDEVNAERTIVLYLGMYLVVEAAAGICYMCSCIFNQSKKMMAVGGGLTIWFFLAALLGMFGSEDMVNMGIGAEVLDNFNKLTIMSLFDADAAQTIGTESVDYGFVPGMCILAALAAVTYVIGGIRFGRKDIPL